MLCENFLKEREFMKRFFTCLLVAVICVITSFSLFGCSPKFTGFSNDTSKVVSNSGIAVEYDGYLYFINGTKTTSESANIGNIVQGAIYKVKLNSDGSVNYSDAEKEEDKELTEVSKVVNALVGFDEGSIHIFGNYLYYVTTSNAQNSDAEVLFGQFEFARIDLISGATETFYTTKTSDDTVSYAYYMNGDNIDFVIYEKNSKLLTSLSINDSITQNFVKEDVESALFSERYGISSKTTSSRVFDDADCYIYYTLKADPDGEFPDGNIVRYATSDGEFDEVLNEANESISLLTIRAGKLIYTVNDYIFADTINDETRKLNYNIDNVENFRNILSYVSYDNVMFVEEENGSITLLVYDGSEIKFISWTKDYPNLTEETIYDFGSSSVKVAFIGLDGDYLVMTVDGLVNKIKVFNATGSEEIVPIKLTTTKFVDAKELMCPKIVGNYVYGFVSESSNNYMYRVSLEIPEGSEVEKAEFIGEKVEE